MPCYLDNNSPGLYIGAYLPNLYRPTNDSKMNHLTHCDGTPIPFEQINTEQLIFSMYGAMTFPDGSATSPPTTVFQGEQVTYQPAVPANQNPPPQFQYSWAIDPPPGVVEGGAPGCGGYQSGPAQCVLDTTTLGFGTHTVQVTVQDATSMLKNPTDIANARGTIQWLLTVNACEDNESKSYYNSPGADVQVQALLSDGDPGWVWDDSVDHHEVDVYTDCMGNVVSESDTVTSVSHYQCQESGPYSWASDPYTIPDTQCPPDYTDTCQDNYDEYQFACPDQTYTEEVPTGTTCSCAIILGPNALPRKKEGR